MLPVTAFDAGIPYLVSGCASQTYHCGAPTICSKQISCDVGINGKPHVCLWSQPSTLFLHHELLLLVHFTVKLAA